MFFECAGVRYRMLRKSTEGNWLICYDKPAAPFYIAGPAMENYQRIPTPDPVIAGMTAPKAKTPASAKRLELIAPLTEDKTCITNKDQRRRLAEQQAEANHTTLRRILRLYYRFLAWGSVEGPPKKCKSRLDTQRRKEYDEAIETYYFSSAKRSLRDAYDCMLLAHYMDGDGKLVEGCPSWYSFRQYYYREARHKGSRKWIARNGLSSYQRDGRLHYGAGVTWKDKIGYYQMDATQGDIYLVSRFDPSLVIGRPYIYLAVDTATELIAGFHVGLTAGETAVTACLVHAACDKVAYCASYGIAISTEQWPSRGIAGGIITDKGREFCGQRMDELCIRYGLERESLPPFRPDHKGLVEKTFDLIQQRYKATLRGKGVIEPDAMERWATDYRSQAVLTLDDYTKILIHIVLYLNGRVLKKYPLTPEMLTDQVEPSPASLWCWYSEMGRSVLMDVDDEKLACTALPRDEARVTRRGIVFRGMTYIDPGLHDLLEQLRGSKVTVAYSPEDTSQAYLLHDHNYYPLPLSQASSRYQGLCEEELAAYQDLEKDRVNRMRPRETEARLQMLEQTRSIAAAKKQEAKGRRLNDQAIQESREQEEKYLT